MDQNGGNQNQYTANNAVGGTPESAEAPLLQWRASEFVDHAKNGNWFTLLALGVIGSSLAIYLVTGDILATLVVLLAGATFGFYARQKPRTLSYALYKDVIGIEQRAYDYDDFRAFSLVKEGGIYGILLEPVRRFMLPLTIYFAPEDGEVIFDILSARIPHQLKRADPIDRLMSRIRF
jgi:hypothetical protein